MTDEQRPWRLDAKCTQITPKEADNIFFPSSGGKATKANEFCRSCPVRQQCLMEAVELELEGFIAGYTVDERKSIRKMKASLANSKSLIQRMAQVLPAEALEKKRRIYRKHPKDFDTIDTLEFLNSIEGPIA